MKTNVIHALLMAALLLPAAGCVKNPVPLQDVRIVCSRTTEKGVIPIAMGESVQLGAEPVPKDASVRAVTWKSDDEEIIRTDDHGMITAVGYGRTEVAVTAFSDDGSGVSRRTGVEVTVVPAKALRITDRSGAVRTLHPVPEGGTLELAARVTPKGASVRETAWASSDEAILTVDREGRVTGRSRGIAEVSATVTTMDRDYSEERLSASVKVMSGEPVTATGLKITCSAALTAVYNGSAAAEGFRLDEGTPVRLGFVTEPANAFWTDAEWSVRTLTGKGRAATLDGDGLLRYGAPGRGRVVLSVKTPDADRRLRTVTAEIAFVTGDVIDFRDKLTESICLRHWDANADGVLTDEEAGAVKELPEKMFYKRYITSFDELRRFRNLKKIGYKSFDLCEELRSVLLPDGVEIISKQAFECCKNLEGLRLPDGIRRIELGAFHGGNPDLFPENLKLPENLEELEAMAFSFKNVASVTFGRKIRNIGHKAFCNNPRLDDVTFLGETPPEGFVITALEHKEDGTYANPQLGPEKERVITIHVPRDAVEKYNKKFYFKDRDLYTDELDYRKDVVYYEWTAEGKDYETCPFHIIPNREIYGHAVFDSKMFGDGNLVHWWIDDIHIAVPYSRFIDNAPNYVSPRLLGKTPEEVEKFGQEYHCPVYLRDYVISIPGRNRYYRFVALPE